MYSTDAMDLHPERQRATFIFLCTVGNGKYGDCVKNVYKIRRPVYEQDRYLRYS